MNRRTSVTLVLAVLLAAGLTGCVPADQHTRDVGYGVTEPVRTLVIQDGTGDVRVTGGTGGEIQVTEHQSYRQDPPATVHQVADGTLTLNYHCAADHDCGVGYQVDVPAGTVVRVTDGTGSVVLSGLTADVEATTGTGGIHAEGLSSPKATLTSSTGDVSAAFVAQPAMVQAKTSTGDVDVRVPTGEPYQVAASAATGEAKVTVAQQDGAAHRITARSSTGDVRVRNA